MSRHIKPSISKNISSKQGDICITDSLFCIKETKTTCKAEVCTKKLMFSKIKLFLKVKITLIYMYIIID